MNQTSEVIATLVHYKVAVRDTMEYTLQKDVYNVDAFKEKKRSVLVEVEQNTPLKAIIGNSGENGQKFEKMVRDFYDQVYADSSTILRLADDGVRVDHAQHIAIFKGVIPIHENVEAMVRGIIQDAKSKSIDVAKAEEVDALEERFYRAVAYLCLTNHLIKLFNDYNQARREARGEESAASRFIGNDINEVVNLIASVRAACHITDERYMYVQDKVFTLIDHMTGRRDLPAGKGFADVIRETMDAIRSFVAEVEPAFRDVYQPFIAELIESARSHNGQIGGGETPAAPADAGSGSGDAA